MRMTINPGVPCGYKTQSRAKSRPLLAAVTVLLTTVKMAELDRNLESNGEPNEMAEEEKQEQTGQDKNSSTEEILNQIQECFGDSVAKAFQGKKWRETAIQLFLSYEPLIPFFFCRYYFVL